MSDRQDLRASSRRRFLVGSGAGAAIVVSGWFPTIASACTREPIEQSGLRESFPRQEIELVQRVVGMSHRSYDAVHELVSSQPALARASWDWGFGDWESALGAASHTGRRSIAALLIEHGARPNIFTFAMLGNLKAVRAIVESAPGVQRTLGPHGITLMSHARAGRDEAKEVVAYLETLGDADIGEQDLPISDGEKSAFCGRYEVVGIGGVIEIVIESGTLSLKHGEQYPRMLRRRSQQIFSPSGSPAVRVEFAVDRSGVTGLSIRGAGEAIEASRVA